MALFAERADSARHKHHECDVCKMLLRTLAKLPCQIVPLCHDHREGFEQLEYNRKLMFICLNMKRKMT